MKPEHIIGIGILMIFIGFVVVFLGSMMAGTTADSKTKVAVGGFIGFIPFGLGNDKRLVWLVMVSSLALFLVWLLFVLRMRA